MNEEKIIIDLYLSGFGSTKICKILPNVTKRKVLKIINDNNIIRNRFLPKEFYDNFWFEDNKWCGNYICEICKNKIKFCVNKKSLLNRNLKKKSKCKECSLKKQIGSGNPFYNKKHSKDSKIKISENRKNKAKGKKNAMAKKVWRKKAKENLKKKWDSGLLENVRKKMSDLMKQRISNGELKSFNRSKAEFEIISILEKKYIVKPNYVIESKIFDIYLPELNLLIEYNGDYWHCNPKKYSENYFNKRKNKTAKEIWEYDKNKVDLSKNNGYNIEIIWETEYKNDKNIVKKIIKKYDTKN